jgi:hypothetical protein
MTNGGGSSHFDYSAPSCFPFRSYVRIKSQMIKFNNDRFRKIVLQLKIIIKILITNNLIQKYRIINECRSILLKI